jgi:DNA topoisomerase-6 subunit B
LQKIATKRTGGEETDEALGKTGSGPEGLPHSIIVTPEGVEGDVLLTDGGDGSTSGSLTREAAGDGTGDLSVSAANQTGTEPEIRPREKQTGDRTSRAKVAAQRTASGRKVAKKATPQKTDRDHKRKRK